MPGWTTVTSPIRRSVIQFCGAVMTIALMAGALVSTPASAGADEFAQWRVAAETEISGRTIELLVEDRSGGVVARVRGAQNTDAVWIDRSTNGFNDHEGLLGYSDTVTDAQTLTTSATPLTDRVDDTVALVRACAHIANATDPQSGKTDCTTSSRSRQSDVIAAARGLSVYDNPETGIFDLDPTDTQPGNWSKWWHSAVATSALVQAAIVTEDDEILEKVDAVYQANKNVDHDGFGGQFRNKYTDDTGWWAMAWIDAYRATGQEKYLNTAQTAADFMARWWNTDTSCGGLYWQLEWEYGTWRGAGKPRSISNSLYLQVNAALFQETGKQQYLDRALQVWQWYGSLDLIDDDGLVQDSIDRETCNVAGTAKYTYNQGVLISGLVELYRATGNESYLQNAQSIATAMMSSDQLNLGGILRDLCEDKRIDQATSAGYQATSAGYRCDNDGPTFKGPAVRGLADLNSVRPNEEIRTYVVRQLDNARAIGSLQSAIVEGQDIYGLRWYHRNTYFGSGDQDSDPTNANQLHVGNQVAGLMLATAVAQAPYSTKAHSPQLLVSGQTGESNWYRTPVTVTVADGVATSYAQSSGDGWQPYQGPYTFGDGIHRVTVQDRTTKLVTSEVIQVDTVPPTLDGSLNQAQRLLTLDGHDPQPGSGLDRIEYRVGSGNWKTYTSPVRVPTTDFEISYRAIDVAGNSSKVQTSTLPPALESAVTAQDISIRPNASTVVFVRVATNNSDVVPTGTVRLVRDGSIVTTSALHKGAGELAVPRNLTVGTHYFQVVYTGSSIAQSSTSTVRIVVTKARAKLKATVKKVRGKRGRYRVAATVSSPDHVTLAGKVRVIVKRGHTTVHKRTVKVKKTGKVRLVLRKMATPGKYRVNITYRGTKHLSPSAQITRKLLVR